MAAELVEKVAVDDGAVLHTMTAGPRGAPPIVLLHGGPGLWDYLEPVATLLDDVLRTHRFDQRGCGRSSPNDHLTMARFVADIDALRVHYGYHRWTVFGHSFGATLALAYAWTHPDRVDRLVYCSGTGLGDGWRATYHAAADARLTAAERSRRGELAGQARTWQEEVEWRALRWQPDYADRRRAAALARVDASVELPVNRDCNTALDHETRSWHEDEVRRQCHRVAAPALLIHGEADPPPVHGVEALATALPTAMLRVLPGAGHSPWVERRNAFARVLRSFLACP